MNDLVDSFHKNILKLWKDLKTLTQIKYPGIPINELKE